MVRNDFLKFTSRSCLHEYIYAFTGYERIVYDITDSKKKKSELDVDDRAAAFYLA